MTLVMPRVVVSQLKHNSYFVAGLCAGLWLALAGVPLGEDEPCAPVQAALAPTVAPDDEFAAVREEKPPAPAQARSIQRPRYYTTELGMRAPLLAAVLSSEDMLDSRVAALNRTAARLQPALRFFMPAAAQARGRSPRANVVAFTDTRQMLKPFHALKYLADNYLDDYNFFFLAADTTFINSRRLLRLAARLSVSQDLYMGTVADDDSHYCTLEGGILMSSSVLRAVQASLDWCVRNSYSPRHHENLGRCVLHAARLPCQPAAQGEQYVSVDVSGEGGVARALAPALASAVAASGVSDPLDMYRLHAYVSRVHLEREAARGRSLGADLGRLRRRAPPRYRSSTWPRGLRLDPALRPLTPDNRFEHLRWTACNATHAFLPEDRRAAAPIPAAHKEALQLVWERARAWAERAWGGSETAGGGTAGASETAHVSLLEGAWRWEPPHALRYRLLVAHRLPGGRTAVRQLEVARPLGAARMAPVPYVTESARVTIILPVAAADARAAAAWLRRRSDLPRNVALCVVTLAPAPAAGWALVRDAFNALVAAQPAATAVLLQATEGVDGVTDGGRLALAAAASAGRLARDALLLVLHPRAEFSDEFLNRVRMNTIAGCAWYLPAPFARYAQYTHPRFVDARGRRLTTHTGRFSRHHGVVAVYRRDWDSALAEWRGNNSASIPEILVASPLRVLSAPEPALVLSPSPSPPCLRASETACLRELRLDNLELGAPQELAKLLLDTQPPAPAA